MLPSPMKALGRRAKENAPDELHISVLTGRTKKVKSLLRKGVHIESVNNLGQTPLFCAAYGGDYEVVELLLKLGANPNRRCGSAGASPVHAAAFRGSRKVLRLLVEAGGDLSARDTEFLTPRDYALKQPAVIRQQKILEFLDLLCAMTLHRTHCARLSPSASSTLASATLQHQGKFNSSLTNTLRSASSHTKLYDSRLSLSRKSSLSSVNLLGSCVGLNTSAAGSPNHHPPSSIPPIPEGNEVPTPNLHKSVSCHLLDQLCVTTSLPLLSPTQLQRPHTPTPAYTCGGPTAYSPFSWIGTPVTVRRPTPALTLHRCSDGLEGSDSGVPDQDAVKALLQELSFLRRLRHPGFLEVMAACHVTHPSPDHVTLVFQSVPHGSLYHHLHEQHRDLSVGSAVDILVNLVEALLFMHAHGWFHCGLSSHALHLVTLGSAKLGRFEYAMESQAKGCGMRAEHLSNASWLKPWQPSETITEKMVSVKSEIYGVVTIMWEIWAGMAPWSGVEDAEMIKRVEAGESLPSLPPSTMVPSLISYVTEYGLKWNAHEREIDLQEIHTMLRSLRIQCNEEERVPTVTSWGPPSIPNTPVIGRHRKEGSSSCSSGSQSDSRLGDKKLLKNFKGEGFRDKECSRRLSQDKSRRLSQFPVKSNFEIAQESIHKHLSKIVPMENKRNKGSLHKEDGDPLRKSFDSGFSTPGSRTPSPTYDPPATLKTPTILTSTPNRHSLLQRFDNPDLLPARISPSEFMSSKQPDPLRNQLEKASPQENYGYVQSPAKRAFLQNGGDPKSESEDLGSMRDVRMDVVKRGLSLNNISTNALSSYPATVFTRTTSHVSLCSSSSGSSSSSEGKKPHRTISQITLIMKKMALSAASSKDDLNECHQKEKVETSDKPKTEDSEKDTTDCAIIKNTNNHSRSGWDEITGIKPASHQLTRHSSSCSLASGPPSPAYRAASVALPLLPSLRQNKLTGSAGSLPTSPQRSLHSQTFPSRSSTLLTGAAAAEAAIGKFGSRRHSETSRPKPRRHRKRHDVEVEEEFIDDEFNAMLYNQPHMQLSVGSSENLLEARLSSLLRDDSDSSSLSGSQFSHHMTSSEDEDDSRGPSDRRVKCRPLLKALEETGDSDNAEEEPKTTKPHEPDPEPSVAPNHHVAPPKSANLSVGAEKGSAAGLPDNKGALDSGASEDEVFGGVVKGAKESQDAKEFDPINSSNVRKSLRKDFSSYLPTYSIGSDSDG